MTKIAFELLMRAAFVYGAAYLLASLIDERLGLLEVHWLAWVLLATIIFVVMLLGYFRTGKSAVNHTTVEKPE